MIIFKTLYSSLKILIITFILTLVIDFFLGEKILNKFDTFFSKSQFYERLIRIDHPIYLHTLHKNIKNKKNVSFTEI